MYFIKMVDLKVR